jgi:glucosamine--fructose-6-phosphate aminotransferase (isomerizing)
VKSNCLPIESEYFRDILEQPRALENTRQGLRVSRALVKLAAGVNKGKLRQIVLTGMGASYHALHPLNVALVASGLAPIMVETSELVHYHRRLFDPETLIIAVSQSGQSAEIVRLLQINRRRAAVLGVTNTPDSPLARLAAAVVLTHAGKEFSVSCKTYLAALIALEWLGDLLCEIDSHRSGHHLALAEEAVSSYLVRWREHVQSLKEELHGARHLFLVGRGPSLAAVGTGGLIVKEAAQFHAEGMSSAAFRHGPFEMLGRDLYVAVFAGARRTEALSERLLRDIRQKKGRCAMIGKRGEPQAFRLPQVPDRLLPVLEILPVQMISLALAERGGRKPGSFVLASKVTRTE